MRKMNINFVAILCMAGVVLGVTVVDCARAAEPAVPGLPMLEGQSVKLLYQDDFDGDLSHWVVEQQKGGTATIVNGQLEIEDAGGCTIWFKEKLSGSIVIEYEATLLKNGGRNDRVSDLNCFWMATDPKKPNEPVPGRRNGVFASYHKLRLYYVGQGGNGNKTTRFRRYPGGGARPLLPEHDLKDDRFMNVPNQTRKIQIVADGARIRYLCDGQVFFDYKDNEPLTEGWFGFRTVQNHMRIDNFRVYQIVENKNQVSD